jgi:hypothetical protein
VRDGRQHPIRRRRGDLDRVARTGLPAHAEIENPLLRTTWHVLDNHGPFIREMRRSGHTSEYIWCRLRAERRSSVRIASLKRWSRRNLSNQNP